MADINVKVTFDKINVKEKIQEHKVKILMLKGEKGDTGEAGQSYDDTEVRGLISANTSDISSLQSDVSANTSDISSLQSSVSANTSDISSLQSSIASELADILEDLFYKNNDTLEITYQTEVSFLGYITGRAKDILFTVPVPKSLKNISQISVDKLEMNIRHVSGGYVGGNNYDFKNYLSSIRKINDHNIDIHLVNSNGWGVTNNTPLSIQPTLFKLIFLE